jgi:integrase
MSLPNPTSPVNPAAAALAEAEAAYRKMLPPGTIWPSGDDAPAVPMGPIPWTQFVSEVEEMYRPPFRALATLRAVRHALGVVTELGHPETTADITIAMVGKIVAARSAGRSNNTTRGLLRTLAAAFSYGQKMGYLRNPFDVRPLKSWCRPSAPLNGHHLGVSTVRVLLDSLAQEVRATTGWKQWRGRRLEAMTNLCVYTGLRRMELLSLKIQDLDLTAMIVRLVDRSAEGGTRLKTAFRSGNDFVPLAPAVIPVMTSWLDHRLDAAPTVMRDGNDWLFPCTYAPRPWVNGSPGHKPLDKLKEAAARCGIPVISWQILRRSCATALCQHAAPGQVQRVMRHSSQSVTDQWYIKRDSDALHATVKDFRY